MTLNAARINVYFLCVIIPVLCIPQEIVGGGYSLSSLYVPYLICSKNVSTKHFECKGNMTKHWYQAEANNFKLPIVTKPPLYDGAKGGQMTRSIMLASLYTIAYYKLLQKTLLLRIQLYSLYNKILVLAWYIYQTALQNWLNIF